MTGKVALVTGGASGIGRAIAERLAGAGDRVLVVDVDEAAARRVARTLGGAALPADVGDPADWREVVARLDRLHVACLNAGVATGSSSIADLTDEAYRRVLRVNVDGVVLGVRALIPLLGAEGADIVVTASLGGLAPVGTDPVYAGTKHFLVGFVRSAASQLAARGVRINAVCPGFTDTPLLRPDEHARFAAAGFPLLRPAEVAEAVALTLASGDTGQAWVCQPGRPPERYRFRGVPGARVAGAGGVSPPLSPA